MEPAKLNKEESAAKAISFALPYYKSCFPFDQKITAEALRCLEQKPGKVCDQPFDKYSCAIPTYTKGYYIQLSYRERILNVSVSSKGFVYSIDKHQEEEQGFTQQAREFLLKHLKDSLPSEQLSQVEIQFVKREALDKLSLKKAFVFSELPKDTVWGWVLNVKTHEGVRKYRMFDTPNETCWKMSTANNEGKSNRKRCLGGITNKEMHAKMNEARQNPAKLAKVHHIVKENIVPEEVMQKVKARIAKWLSYRYPLALNIGEIACDKTVWRDDIRQRDFWPDDSKWLPELKTNGYESEFTCQGETFKVRYSLQGEKIRCEELENMKSLPRSVIEDLRVEVAGNPNCRVLSFEHEEDEEHYNLRYMIDGTTTTLVRKY